MSVSSHLATASSEPASGKAWQNRFLFLPQLPFSKQRAGLLSRRCVYRRTEVVVTNWSRGWQHCVCVLFLLPPACARLEPYSESCLVCSVTIVVLQNVCRKPRLTNISQYKVKYSFIITRLTNRPSRRERLPNNSTYTSAGDDLINKLLRITEYGE